MAIRLDVKDGGLLLIGGRLVIRGEQQLLLHRCSERETVAILRTCEEMATNRAPREPAHLPGGNLCIIGNWGLAPDCFRLVAVKSGQAGIQLTLQQVEFLTKGLHAQLGEEIYRRRRNSYGFERLLGWHFSGWPG